MSKPQESFAVDGHARLIVAVAGARCRIFGKNRIFTVRRKARKRCARRGLATGKRANLFASDRQARDNKSATLGSVKVKVWAKDVNDDEFGGEQIEAEGGGGPELDDELE